MIMKCLVFLVIAPLCCWGETRKPARDYTMIDVQNGLNAKLLEIGTTSFTFFVEWPLGMDIESKWMILFGKFHLDSGWNGLVTMEIDPLQGNATFEIEYDAVPWSYFETEKVKFEQRAFFHFAVQPLDDTGWLGPRPEDEETETQRIPNRLCLYLVLSLGVLCVIAYFFMRKKSS